MWRVELEKLDQTRKQRQKEEQLRDQKQNELKKLPSMLAQTGKQRKTAELRIKGELPLIEEQIKRKKKIENQINARLDNEKQRRIKIEEQILARLDKAELPQDIVLYLYALGELSQSRYSDTVLPFLESDNPEVRLTALKTFIRLHGTQLERHKARLLKALESPDNEMKIVVLQALKNCQPLNSWAPVIQLLGAIDRRLVKESKELLELYMNVCKPVLIETLSTEKISVQQRFEILSLIYHKLSSKQQQDLQQWADKALKNFVRLNGLLKLHESLEHTNPTYELIRKNLAEMTEYHLDHVLLIITFAAKQDKEFFQKVSNGLKSSSRTHQGNALEVLSAVAEKHLVNQLFKYFDERFFTLQSIRRIYFALYGKPLKIDKKDYEEHLQALNNDLIEACLLYIGREKSGVLNLENTSQNVCHLLS